MKIKKKKTSVAANFTFVDKATSSTFDHEGPNFL